VAVNPPNITCGSEPTVFNETFTGILSLLAAQYGGPVGNESKKQQIVNPFVFLLDGWVPNTNQTLLAAERSVLSYLPWAVKLEWRV
jgi:hypothetical protein